MFPFLALIFGFFSPISAQCPLLDKHSLTMTLLKAFSNDVQLATSVSGQVLPYGDQSYFCRGDVDSRVDDFGMVYPLYTNVQRRALADPWDADSRERDITNMKSLLHQWKDNVVANTPGNSLRYLMTVMTDATERAMVSQVCALHFELRILPACAGHIALESSPYSKLFFERAQ